MFELCKWPVGLLEYIKDRIVRRKLTKITPSNKELLALAKHNPPPQKWYEEDELMTNEQLN
jgi:hypothetical protein